MANKGEVFIELRGDTREDGSVMITCDRFPLFSIVGESEEDALSIAMEFLPEYLTRNVPQFVDLGAAVVEVRQVPEAIEVTEHQQIPMLPAHIIAKAQLEIAQ